jgi:hypothetical protein
MGPTSSPVSLHTQTHTCRYSPTTTNNIPNLMEEEEEEEE